MQWLSTRMYIRDHTQDECDLNFVLGLDSIQISATSVRQEIRYRIEIPVQPLHFLYQYSLK